MNILRLSDAVYHSSDNKDCSRIPDKLINNSNISGKAMKIYCILLSNKPGTISTVESIKKYMKEGKTAIIKALSELEKFGYLKRIKYRDKKTKRIIGSFWAVTDTPHKFLIKSALAKLNELNMEIIYKI